MMNLSKSENPLWAERYRPKTVSECILPADIKATMQNIVDSGNIPNIMLAGGPGVGKTTVAKAMLEELDCNYIVINGSMSGNIDTLRTEIKDFASTVSFVGGRKYVLLDESDHLSALTQAALRNFMEEYSANCGFILTCNYPAKIIEALHSRCPPVYFKIEKKDKVKLASQFLKRAELILKSENVPYSVESVANLITKYFPDWRRVLNELQTYSNTGSIDDGILKGVMDDSFSILLKAMRSKSFKDIRAWVGENSDVSPADFYRFFYDRCSEFFRKDDLPQLIIHIAEYQYKSNFVADQEINTMAFLINVMADCEFI